MSASETQGHQQDVAALYEQVRSRLRAAASRLVGWDDAEDVVQDAFVKALAFPGAFRGDASITTWITRIVVNAAIDETRRRKRRPRVDVKSDGREDERGVMPDPVQWLALKSALADSRPIDRQVLVLAGLLGCSYEETARRLGIAVGTTKSRLCTARGRLRQAMLEGKTRRDALGARFPYRDG